MEQTLRDTPIIEITDIERFVGQKEFHIVSGKDAAGNARMVWITEGEAPVVVDPSSGVSRERMLEMAERDAEKHIIRISPAKWHNDLAWELFYYREEDGGRRYYYDFYSFASGQWLETYKLSKRPN